MFAIRDSGFALRAPLNDGEDAWGGVTTAEIEMSPDSADLRPKPADTPHLIVAHDEEVVIEHHPEDWIAFALRSARAERSAGLAVVLAIFVSACVAGYEAVHRLVEPADVEHLGALALAGAIGFAGNWIDALVRSRAGRRLDSPALVADGAHARADAYVSLAVVASAAVVALGLQIADPLIGLGITFVILRITWQSWRTVRGHDH